ncbi:Aspartyl/Asparaginyl beta-hydroxylase [compost metagenome]
MFISVDDYPEISRLAESIERQADTLRGFAMRAGDAFMEWPEPLHEGGWDVLALKWQGQVVLPVIELFPWLARSLVWNAGFSRLRPGTVIEPHTGYSSDVLRLHFGLDCPAGASITVGGETRAWRDGEFLLFDDTLLHSARNDGDRDRLILLVDAKKSGH